MSGGIDDLASMHGGSMEADMGCDANAMMEELDHHRSVACASDVVTDRAEAVKHVQAMSGYGGHAVDRCDEMLSGFSGGGWSWRPMMSGCRMMFGGGMM